MNGYAAENKSIALNWSWHNNKRLIYFYVVEKGYC
jgi:hypothetical protein